MKKIKLKEKRKKRKPTKIMQSYLITSPLSLVGQYSDYNNNNINGSWFNNILFFYILFQLVLNLTHPSATGNVWAEKYLQKFFSFQPMDAYTICRKHFTNLKEN